MNIVAAEDGQTPVAVDGECDLSCLSAGHKLLLLVLMEKRLRRRRRQPHQGLRYHFVDIVAESSLALVQAWSSTVESSLVIGVPAAVVADMLIAVVDASVAGAVQEDIDLAVLDYPVDENGFAEDSDAGAQGSHQHKLTVQDSHMLAAHKIADDVVVGPWTLRAGTRSHALL